MTYFCKPVQPDAQEFLSVIARQGTPRRTHYVELFLDAEVRQAIGERFEVWQGLDRNDPQFDTRGEIALQRFLGYDYVRCGLDGWEMPIRRLRTADTAALARADGRRFAEEHVGVITTWQEFEQYPWPDLTKADDRALAWYEKNLPDDMCVIGWANAHFCEWLCWLMGYETLCYALYEQPDLVTAIYEKVHALVAATMDWLDDFSRVKVIWGSDDMGFRSGTLISPQHMRRWVLPGHRMAAARAHARGRPYFLHSCGQLREILPDLIDDVGIDAKHSYEDTIEDVRAVKGTYGQRIAVLGGIDVDFLCRADEPAIRRRVRETLAVCNAGGGYCLGTGNSVANYIPVDHYLAMLDEGRRWQG